jgi:alkanesulfonate monooxygenase SsuD/methylene tetrahydromethanopterin reductase-like flavin-dependent oxidoreductase (luciferase family)
MDIAEARARFEQAIQLLKRAWTEPEPFAFHTEYFHYDMVSALPRPIQRPHPPIWMACNSAESLEFAARERLGVATSWSPTDQVAETFDYYRTYAREQCGWDPSPDHFAVSRDVYVAATMQEALDEAAEDVEAGQDDDFGGGPNPAYKRRMEHDQYSTRSFAYKSSEHIGVFQVRGWRFEQLQLEGLAIVGDPAYVAGAILEQQRALGIGHFFVRPMFGRLGPDRALRSVELYAQEVLPRLRGAAVGV